MTPEEQAIRDDQADYGILLAEAYAKGQGQDFHDLIHLKSDGIEVVLDLTSTVLFLLHELAAQDQVSIADEIAAIRRGIAERAA